MRELVYEDLHEANLIFCDVSNYMCQAKALIDMAWERVAEGIKARDGRAGCLKGKVEDYVQSIDAMIAAKDAAFAKNRQALEVKIERGNPKLNNMISKIQDKLSSVQHDIEQMFNPPQIEVEF